MKKSLRTQLLSALICLAVGLGASQAQAQFSYVNANQGVTFVPYGGSFAYAVSWTNGTYVSGSTAGTWVQSFVKPGSTLGISALFPSTGGFSYNVPFVSSTDEGQYFLNLDGTGSNSLSTSPVILRVTPGILQQPTNTSLANGQTTSMGLVAGPLSSTYTWINAINGNTITSGSSFTVNSSMNGLWVYCKISNAYGNITTTPAQISLFTNAVPSFGYVNNNPGVSYVPYGGSYTYSVSWTNGNYYYNGAYGTYVYTFFKPGNSLSVNALFPSTGGFSYTVPFVTGADDGTYNLNLSGSQSSLSTSQVYLRVTPGILQQPTNAILANGQQTTMGLIAGPSGASYTWINSVTGSTVASGTTFMANNNMNGMWIYCRISNNYGSINTSPVLLSIGTNTAPFACVNNNPGLQIVPYGSSFTYSVSWTNGTYLNNGSIGTWVNTLNKPGGSLGISALFPSAGGFTYNIPFVTSSDDGPYNLNLNGTGSSSFTTSPVNLRVSPAIVWQPVDTTVASGISTSMGMFAGPSTATFTWLDAVTGGTVANGSTFIVNNSMDGKRIYCKISNTYGYILSTPVVIHIGSLTPILTSQPTNQTVVLGQPVTFRVAASGAPTLSYAWFHNGFLIDGANQNFITLSPTTNSDAGAYTCRVSNPNGSTNSVSATLGIATYPAILSQPQSLTVTQGQAAVFSAVAEGSPLAYSWRKNGAPIFGATNSSLVISHAAATDMATYTLLISNGLGTVTSTGAVLTVYSAPFILDPPAAQMVGLGSNFTLSVTAVGYPSIAYQWRLNSSVIPDATNLSYSVAAALNTDAGNYDVVLANSAGSITSSIASVVVVTDVPVITVQPADETVALGSPGSLSVSATGSLLNYQWYRLSTNAPAAAVPAVFGGFVLGATVTNSGSGYVVSPNVQIMGGGGSGATAAAAISNGMVVAVYITSTGFGYTSEPLIQIDPPAFGLAGQTAPILNFPAVATNDAGTYFVVITNVAGSVCSSNASLMVGVPVYIVSQPQSQAVSVGSIASFSVTVGGSAPFAYQWYNGSAIPATATALAYSGYVYGANLTSGGSGYVTAPNVQFIGGGGSGALATAVLSNDVVTAIVVTNPGSGYTNVPAVVIDAPPSPPLSGQTNSVFNLTVVSTNDAAYYFVVVTNDYGSVTSVLVSLTINLTTSNIVNVPVPPLMTLAVDSAALHLQFVGNPGDSYVLLSTESLTPPVNWQPVCTNSIGTNGCWEFTDTNLNLGQKFYRAVGVNSGQ